MTNRNKKSRIAIAGSFPDMVCIRKQASHLLQGLRKDYQLLTPEERNQVKCFMLGLYSERHPPPYNPQHAEIGSGTLIEQFQKSLMEDEKIDKEEVWSAIRYLDPDEGEKDKESNTVTIIAILALLLIVGGVWVLLWLRVRQP
jgi:hypothetical protein